MYYKVNFNQTKYSLQVGRYYLSAPFSITQSTQTRSMG